MTILTDIVDFGLYYAVGEILYKSSALDLFRFSGGMAILSLLLKPVSCFFAYQMYRERGGEYNVNFGKWRLRGEKIMGNWLIMVQSTFWHMWKFFCEVKMAALFALVCLKHYWAYLRHYNS